MKLKQGSIFSYREMEKVLRELKDCLLPEPLYLHVSLSCFDKIKDVFDNFYHMPARNYANVPYLVVTVDSRMDRGEWQIWQSDNILFCGKL